MLRLTSARYRHIVEVSQVSRDDCFAALCLVPSGFAYAPPKRTLCILPKTAPAVAMKSDFRDSRSGKTAEFFRFTPHKAFPYQRSPFGCRSRRDGFKRLARPKQQLSNRSRLEPTCAGRSSSREPCRRSSVSRRPLPRWRYRFLPRTP